VLYFLSAAWRRLGLDRIHLPAGISICGLAGSFLLPGLGFYLRSRVWGKLAFTTCAVLAINFVIWLGYPVANFAFGLLLSIHVSGFTYYCSPWLSSETLGKRMFVAILLTISLSALIYFPLRNAMQERYFMPLKVENRVVVFRRMFSASAVKRGDAIAYTLEEIYADNVHAHGGLTTGKVLAMPGDQITFTPSSFIVNGQALPRLEDMPTAGGVVVAENYWFIWPNLARIGGHGNVSEATISSIMLQMANVPQEKFAGKPYNRWFGRHQTL
jgi:hypothetical protein